MNVNPTYIIAFCHFLKTFLLPHEPDGKEQHQEAVSRITEHHREQEGVRYDGEWHCEYRKGYVMMENGTVNTGTGTL